ncbi:MAG: stage III sporulation protein AE [Muribaculaceae bacterium]|nr:stage III sporulation protein AE [Roseburia sp.]MCM1430536.1 stage III sporulation protein AE [Muribaculaceae bacterium]MCM1492643.1 stage III sporulation protein AE [Muribaculaceae bacterium]
MNFLHRIFLLLSILLAVGVQPVWAMEGGEKPEEDGFLAEILGEMDFKEVDDFSVQELPERMTFSSLVTALANEGDEGFDFGMIGEYLLDLFFYEIEAARPMFFQLLSVSVLFSLFGKVLVTKQSYVNDLGFFAVYTAVMLLLMNSFLLVHDVVEAGIEKMISFMTAFIPTYAATLLLSANPSSAGMFYELAFVLIYLLEIAMKALFIPGVHVFVLLVMMDNLFEEAKLTKLADMIESAIRAAMKLSLAAVVGLGVVQSLLAPAKDRLSANSVFKTMQAVPGVGNTFGATGELLLGCGILIKNSVGTAALVILVVLSAAPAISVACFCLLYRLVGALLQPFCDKRIAECVHGVGRGCGLYLKIVVDAMLLLFITIAMISAFTSFMH